MCLRPFKLFFCLIALLLGACTSEHIIDIQGKDDNAIYSVQTTFPVTGDASPIYLKLKTSKVRADFLQEVPDGKYIFFQDIQVTGPDAVSVESDISTTTLGLGFIDSAKSVEKLSIAVFIGASQTDFSADVFFQSGSNIHVRDNIKELYIDGAIWYEFADRLKAGLAYALSMNADVSGFDEIDLFLNYLLFPHLELAIGLRDYTYRYNEGDSRSGIEVQSRGPFISLNFPF